MKKLRLSLSVVKHHIDVIEKNFILDKESTQFQPIQTY